MTGPLHDRGDGLVGLGGLDRQDVDGRVDDEGVPGIDLAEPVLALCGGQLGRLEGVDGVGDGSGRLVGHQVIPVVVHAERRVGSLVDMGGADDDAGAVGHVVGQELAGPAFDLGGIDGEDHVDVDGHDHDQVLTGGQGDGRRPQVVVDPGAVVGPVADIDLALVPRGDEDPRIVGVVVVPRRRLVQVGPLAVDGRQHAATGRPGQEIGGLRRRGGPVRRRRVRAAGVVTAGTGRRQQCHRRQRGPTCLHPSPSTPGGGARRRTVPDPCAAAGSGVGGEEAEQLETARPGDAEGG